MAWRKVLRKRRKMNLISKCRIKRSVWRAETKGTGDFLSQGKRESYQTAETILGVWPSRPGKICDNAKSERKLSKPLPSSAYELAQLTVASRAPETIKFHVCDSSAPLRCGGSSWKRPHTTLYNRLQLITTRIYSIVPRFRWLKKNTLFFLRPRFHPKFLWRQMEYF